MFVRVPGVYLTSKLFPTTLFPMGLATATGSLLSVIICVVAFAVITKKRDGKLFQMCGKEGVGMNKQNKIKYVYE